MDSQSLASAVLLLPAAVFAAIAWRARRVGRVQTSFGLGLRGGAAGEFGRGVVFSVPFLALLVILFAATGLSRMHGLSGNAVEIAGVWLYFLVLFLLEEVVFRAALMTGLAVVFGQTAALVVTTVLVAAPYALTSGTGVLPLAGAVVTNLLHGWARWRSGRIWWGLGQRWVWNSGVVTFGFADSAFSLQHPAVSQQLTGPPWLTGGSFGVEGGLVGILFLAVMAVAATRFAHGARGPWRVDHERAHPSDPP